MSDLLERTFLPLLRWKKQLQSQSCQWIVHLQRLLLSVERQMRAVPALHYMQSLRIRNCVHRMWSVQRIQTKASRFFMRLQAVIFDCKQHLCRMRHWRLRKVWKCQCLHVLFVVTRVWAGCRNGWDLCEKEFLLIGHNFINYRRVCSRWHCNLRVLHVAEEEIICKKRTERRTGFRRESQRK